MRAPSLAFDMEVLYTLPSQQVSSRKKEHHSLDILHNIDLSLVLAERSDTDTVRAIAHQSLHYNIGAVGLEGDTIIAIINVRILDNDAVGSVRVPPIRVLGSGFCDTERPDDNV